MSMKNDFFRRGDLVEIDFGYQAKSVGVVTGRPEADHWRDTRMWVLVDGDELPVPREQIILLRRAKK